MSRYELKKGKFGFYYYDSHIDIDLNLEMVLNKLNNSEKLREQKNYLLNEVNQLRIKLILKDGLPK